LGRRPLRRQDAGLGPHRGLPNSDQTIIHVKIVNIHDDRHSIGLDAKPDHEAADLVASPDKVRIPQSFARITLTYRELMREFGACHRRGSARL
jgi:hypothetical protein